MYQKLTLDANVLDRFSVSGNQVVGLLTNLVLDYANQHQLEIVSLFSEKEERLHVIFKKEGELPVIDDALKKAVVYQNEVEKAVLNH